MLAESSTLRMVLAISTLLKSLRRGPDRGAGGIETAPRQHLLDGFRVRLGEANRGLKVGRALLGGKHQLDEADIRLGDAAEIDLDRRFRLELGEKIAADRLDFADGDCADEFDPIGG